MPDPILQTKELSKRYGDFSAIADVDIQVMPGTIHGIIGPNGAGKTTLFNCLAGTVPISSGTILLEDRDIGRLPQHARPLIGIGRSYQVTNLFADLSVFENLRLAWQALKPAQGFVFWRPVSDTGAGADHVCSVIDRIGLNHEANTPVAALSHGQQRLTEVGMALTARPRVLLLDEPTSGMGIDDVPEVIKLLRSLRSECTIVLIEHNVGVVTEVCDVVTVMQGGSVIAVGTPEEISVDEKVKKAYLGEDL